MTMVDVGGVMPEECEWCGEAPWRFRCTTCDPRKTKYHCIDCARRWHSRGFSREHPLEDRAGTTRSYLEWLAHILPDPAATTCTTAPVVDGNIPSSSAMSPTEGDGNATKSVTNEGSVVEEAQAIPTEVQKATLDHGGASGEDTEDKNVPEVPQEIPTQLSEETQLDLEDVLNRLPSDDCAILDALADHIHDMIRLEDAVLCQQHTNCQAPTCQALLTHKRHVTELKVCATPTCQSIASYLTHMEFCKKQSCPFCVRIKQRKYLGMKQALDHMIHDQRRQLETLRRDASNLVHVNLLMEQIRSCHEKKHHATSEVEALNRIVVDERLPIFNFPRFSWHIANEPVIKEEPVHDQEMLGSEGPTESTSPPPAISDSAAEEKYYVDKEDRIADDGTKNATVAAAEGQRNPHILDGQDNSHTDISSQDDYVSSLLNRKDSGDQAATAQFEESVRLAYRIVDASFCSPSKAARCLLDCQNILLHLQHHVDLQVCNDRMCETVEQHFSHVSKCQNEGKDAACEYCIRVMERQYSRAVEVMEAEQPETDLKIQRLITGITESLSNDPRDEREQNVFQLEDELQQAEDYKKALTIKINTARMNLLKARRRMKRHLVTPTASHVTGLPLHWIKAARTTSPSSSSSSSRRRTH